MADLTAKRTLVKSPPELWEELSEAERLASHLEAFGEIKITKLEPEHTVAWEGEHASGTVSIEPSGWGTKVTLHAELPEDAALEAEKPAAEEPPIVEPEPIPEEEQIVEEPIAVAEPEPVVEEPIAEQPAAPEPVAEEPQPEPKRRGFWGWLFRTRTESSAVEPEQLAVEPEPEPVEPGDEGSDPVDAPVPERSEDQGGLTPAEEPDEEPAEEPGPGPDPAVDPERARAILDEALDALGAAHHRPFSRG